MKIFIAAPAGVATGGPELLHQLCFVLRQNKFEAYMYYYEEKDVSPVHIAYKDYNNPYVLESENINMSVNDVFVIPETNINLFNKAGKAKKVFWWLSVDNFYSQLKPWKLIRRKQKAHRWKLLPLEKFLNKRIENYINEKQKTVMKIILQRDMVHLVQSYYAFYHCLDLGIDKKQIMYLSDYINPLFVKEAYKLGNTEKKNIVLYNPAKGKEFTEKLINNSNFSYVPLKGFSRNQMIRLLKKAKVYIDFGNHPGKDRIPREAAICGCCIITDKKGSAKYFEDVPIPEIYKFEDKVENIPSICEKIQDIFDNYEQRNKDFEKYRRIILGEESKFKLDVVKVFNKIVDCID